eukprot:TRINITY_DN30140_c0_g1_i1.p1 TRINITY_DN30140_c0_g1~~TRINITY_DN30140_c0_g1_i1.p1  ORF type:complete len:1073 (-),score=168.83 TRINITY_DN30140_c0_g1_i1:589-3771(-)
MRRAKLAPQRGAPAPSSCSSSGGGRGSTASDHAKRLHRDRIKVAVRARPLNSREQGNCIVWKIKEDSIEELKDDGITPTGTNSHSYDYVFAPGVGTGEVYAKQCKEIVEGALEGYNGTVFCYGQTSSGKTFTLLGDMKENPGVSMLACDDVFQTIQRARGSEWSVNASYLEIYNESITDLLNPNSQSAGNLKIYEDKIWGPRIKDAAEKTVESTQDCIRILQQGEKNRHYASTGMNDTSSRSHTVFQLRIESKPVSAEQKEESSKNMRGIATKFQAVQKQLHAERATFYIVDQETQELQSLAGEIIISLPISQGLAGACASTGETIVIEDVYEDPRFNREHDQKTGFRSRSMCIVPIAKDGFVMAVAQFLNKTAGAVFDSQDTVLAEAFAEECAPLMAAAQAVARLSSSGLLNLVDLAGSERVQKTGATGSVLKEAGHINKSLMALGACILALSEGKQGHIPFRDSKLTMLLSSSLGGNARTAIICSISPAARNRNETVSTLQFANRAKRIINKVHQNVHKDNSELLGQYMTELENLKDEVRHVQIQSKWKIAGLKAALLAKTGKCFDLNDNKEFDERLTQLKGEVAQAEAIANAMAPSSAPQISLCAVIVTNADNSSERSLAVQVKRYPKTGAEQLPLELISEDELRARLAWLQKMKARPEDLKDTEVWHWAPAQSSSSGAQAASEASTSVPPHAPKEASLTELRRLRAELDKVRDELDELERLKVHSCETNGRVSEDDTAEDVPVANLVGLHDLIRRASDLIQCRHEEVSASMASPDRAPYPRSASPCRSAQSAGACNSHTRPVIRQSTPSLLPASSTPSLSSCEGAFPRASVAATAAAAAVNNGRSGPCASPQIQRVAPTTTTTTHAWHFARTGQMGLGAVTRHTLPVQLSSGPMQMGQYPSMALRHREGAVSPQPLAGTTSPPVAVPVAAASASRNMGPGPGRPHERGRQQQSCQLPGAAALPTRGEPVTAMLGRTRSMSPPVQGTRPVPSSSSAPWPGQASLQSLRTRRATAPPDGAAPQPGERPDGELVSQLQCLKKELDNTLAHISKGGQVPP